MLNKYGIEMMERLKKRERDTYTYTLVSGNVYIRMNGNKMAMMNHWNCDPGYKKGEQLQKISP